MPFNLEKLPIDYTVFDNNELKNNTSNNAQKKLREDLKFYMGPTLNDLRTALRERSPLELKDSQRVELIHQIQESRSKPDYDYTITSKDKKTKHPCNLIRLFLEIPQRFETHSKSFGLPDSSEGVAFEMDAEQLGLFAQYLDGSLRTVTNPQLFQLSVAAMDNDLKELRILCDDLLLERIVQGELKIDAQNICQLLYPCKNAFLLQASMRKVQELTQGKFELEWIDDLEAFSLIIRGMPANENERILLQAILPHTLRLRPPNVTILRDLLNQQPQDQPLRSIQALDLPFNRLEQLTAEEIRKLLHLFPNLEMLVLYNPPQRECVQQGLYGKRVVWLKGGVARTLVEKDLPAGETLFILPNGSFDASQSMRITDIVFQQFKIEERNCPMRGTFITERSVPSMADKLDLQNCPRINWGQLKFTRLPSHLDVRNNPALPQKFLMRVLKQASADQTFILVFSESDSVTKEFVKEVKTAFPKVRLLFEETSRVPLTVPAKRMKMDDGMQS